LRGRAKEPSTDDTEPKADEELEHQEGEVLPDREVMSIIDVGEGPIWSLPVEPRN
jgi:hypothetical protein